MCVLRGRGGMLCAWFWVVSSEGFVCVVLGCRWWVVLKEGVYSREDVCVVARERSVCVFGGGENVCVVVGGWGLKDSAPFMCVLPGILKKPF